MVPPGAPHTFENPGDDTVVLLNTFTPDLSLQYFRDLHDMIASGQPLSDEAVISVMARYERVPVVPCSGAASGCAAVGGGDDPGRGACRKSSGSRCLRQGVFC